MGTDIQRILFASDLSKHAPAVFRYAVSLAGRYEASIVILHVMEAAPPGVEEQVASAIGSDLYQELKTQKKEGARHILINKKSDALRIQEELIRMHQVTEAHVDFEPRRVSIADVIVTEGDPAEEIVINCAETSCDVIVMGSPHRGMLAEKLTGGIVRKVLRRTRKPVFLVPIGE